MPSHEAATGPWRQPREESVDLYPGLVVDDARVSGSITVGRTRLPLWAFIGSVVDIGWGGADDYYPEDGSYEEIFGRLDAAGFFCDLMEQRGEFGRLLLVLADAERCERAGSGKMWWQTKRHRKRVGDQLRRCLVALGESHE